MYTHKSVQVVKIYESKYSNHAQVLEFDFDTDWKQSVIVEQHSHYKDREYSVKVEKSENSVKVTVHKYSRIHAKITFMVAIKSNL